MEMHFWTEGIFGVVGYGFILSLNENTFIIIVISENSHLFQLEFLYSYEITGCYSLKDW